MAAEKKAFEDWYTSLNPYPDYDPSKTDEENVADEEPPCPCQEDVAQQLIDDMAEHSKRDLLAAIAKRHKITVNDLKLCQRGLLEVEDASGKKITFEKLGPEFNASAKRKSVEKAGNGGAAVRNAKEAKAAKGC